MNPLQMLGLALMAVMAYLIWALVLDHRSQPEPPEHRYVGGCDGVYSEPDEPGSETA